MNTIKNIHKIDQLISARDLTKLEEGAKLHLRHSNISFKIMGISANGLFIKTEQGKHLSENYADEHRLIELTKDLFIKPKYTLDFDPGDILNESGEIDRAKVMVHSYPYVVSPIDQVDSKWVNEQMLKTGTKAKDIAADTGIEKTNISPWINDKKPMSQIVKAMFYYYFQSKEGQPKNQWEWIGDNLKTITKLSNLPKLDMPKRSLDDLRKMVKMAELARAKKNIEGEQ